jgi:hypothetical protein
MTTFWLALPIIALLHGARSSLRTFRHELADPRNRWLFAVCVVIVVCGIVGGSGQ